MEIAIALLVSAIITSVVNYSTAQSANEQSMINQMNQNNWNARQAQIAREWESPANQMKLFQDAGINPAMAASGLTGISGKGILAASGSGAPVFQPDFSNLMQIAHAYAGGKNEIAQAENTNKQTGWIDKLNETQIEEAYSRMKRNYSEAFLHETNAEQLLKFSDAKLENLQTQTNEMLAQIEHINSLIKRSDKQTELFGKEIEKTDAQISNISADTELKNQLKEESSSRVDLNKQNVIESLSRVEMNNTKNLLMESEIDLNNTENLLKLQDAVAKDIELFYNKNGYYPENGWIKNALSRLVGPQKANNADEVFSEWNDMIDQIKQRIASQNRPSNNKNSTNSWNNTSRTNWYGE